MDLRPVSYVIGLLLIPLGFLMLVSASLDYWQGQQSWGVFGGSSLITVFLGVVIALASRGQDTRALTIKQAFILTTFVWVVLPLLGALPFVLGVPHASWTDAYFEAMSGMTTTGSTVFVGLDDMPMGVLLWRGILQWLGGLGIVIVAFVFLPVMRVGGMQFFKSEGFDTLGKVLPRATDISRSLLFIYIYLTLACIVSYIVFGMNSLDATVHGLTTVSTGGFSTSDQSFAKFSGPLEYVSVIFMVLASIPFVRLIQMSRGNPRPFFEDIQVRTYVRWLAVACGLIIGYRMLVFGGDPFVVLRETVFNVVTLFSGTGYGSADITAWGAFSFAVIFCAGLIGGCTGSTGCSIKVFRWIVALEAIKSQIRRVRSPHSVAPMRIDGQPVTEDVVKSVAAFFTIFILTMGVIIIMLSLTGLDRGTAITAGWTAIANVGPAFGPEVGPTGAMDAFPTSAKWIMIFGMLVGRLELLSVFVLLVPSFWRD